MTTGPLDASLTAEITLIDPQHLGVTYRLENTGRDELLVFDRLFRTAPSGERALDETMAYVQLQPPDLIHVTRSTIPIPPGVKVEHPEVPYASILAPGKSLSGKAVVAVPVREDHPYSTPLADDEAERSKFVIVSFSIGALVKRPGLKLGRPPETPEGVHSLSYADAVKGQVLLRSRPARMAVDALVPWSKPRPAKR
jgi:hypothetical protein